MSRPSFMKSSILLCYNINKLTYRVHMSPFLPLLSPPVDVHFKWLHFNTVSLSSDTSIYSQYSQYTLQLDLFLFLRQSFNVLKENKK